jgi:glucan phosphoethanolaminetransferase (alkaline phosphatase superfamily)
MDKETKKIESLSWEVTEYEKPQRGKTWYIYAAIFILLAIFFSFFKFQDWHIVFLGVQSNFLFALFIIMAGAIMFIQDGREPAKMIATLGAEGLNLGQSFHDYDEFKNFSVIYKPNLGINKLYLEFKGIRQRLSLSLGELNPLDVRNFLLQYLEEDLDRTNEPLSEQLTKLFKL